jgi:hypothetical protein
MSESHPSEPPVTGAGDVRLAAVWQDFCERLAKAGEVLLRPQAPGAPLDQAEGLRYLSRLTRTALNMLVDSSDPDFPRIFRMTDDKIKIGADNPDNIYQHVVVAGDRDYRIWGRRGTVPYLSLGTKANRYAVDGTMVSTGEIEFAEVQLEPDGGFEIIASREPRERNWLPMANDTSLLIVRQTFEDRATQTPAEIHIERLGGPAAPALLTPEKIAAQLQQSAAWVAGTANTFAEWSEWFSSRVNQIYEADQSIWYKAGGDPKIWYGHACYDLAPGEAWVLEVTPPPSCRFWNFQLDNWWMESLDYEHHKIWVNSAQARLEPDGRVVVVCADRDPGFGNWVDLAGHRKGTALWRWVESNEHPVPRCKVVRL